MVLGTKSNTLKSHFKALRRAPQDWYKTVLMVILYKVLVINDNIYL